MSAATKTKTLRLTSRAKSPKRTAKKVQGHAPTHDAKLLALITRPEGATVREMLDATGWTHSALKAHVTNVIRKQLGHAISIQRNPGVDPADRALTMYLYFAAKA